MLFMKFFVKGIEGNNQIMEGIEIEIKIPCANQCITTLTY